MRALRVGWPSCAGVLDSSKCPWRRRPPSSQFSFRPILSYVLAFRPLSRTPAGPNSLSVDNVSSLPPQPPLRVGINPPHPPNQTPPNTKNPSSPPPQLPPKQMDRATPMVDAVFRPVRAAVASLVREWARSSRFTSRLPPINWVNILANKFPFCETFTE